MTTTEPGAAVREDTAPATPPSSAEDVLDRLRRPETPTHLFRGFGPLVLAAILIVVMMLLAPSVAPEVIIERPVGVDGEVGG